MKKTKIKVKQGDAAERPADAAIDAQGARPTRPVEGDRAADTYKREAGGGKDAKLDSGTTASPENLQCAEAQAKPAESDSVQESAEPVDRVAGLEAKVAKLEDSLLRAKADYQNLQRRSLAEQTEAIVYANAALMKSLLVVVDDFQRSLAAAQDSDNLAAVVEGVRLVYENFMKALSEHGLQEITALHRPFDPAVHEALMRQPSTDHPPGTVLQEIAKGYRLRERVVRPTKVVVSQAVGAEERGDSGDRPSATSDG